MLKHLRLGYHNVKNVVLHYQSYHIYGGVPQGGGGSGSCLLTNKDSINKYSTTLQIPLWNAYRLDGNVCMSWSIT